jgi:parallel beta-helix repeat protein
VKHPTPRAVGISIVVIAVLGVTAMGLLVTARSYRAPLLLPSFSPPPEAIAAPDCTTRVQSLVDAAAPGSTVTLPSCLARESVTIDKPLTLRGTPGAEIRGSDHWTAWIPDGATWLSRDVVPPFERRGVCRTGDGCLAPEQVFRDGAPLGRVGGSPGAGQFALDAARHVILGMAPEGHFLEVTTRIAWVVIAAQNVTVSDFVMRHAANPPQAGAILNVAGAGHDTVSQNVLAFAHGSDVALDHGNGNAILDNDVGFAGQLGVHLGGSGTLVDGHDNVVRGNRIHNNNLAVFDPEWEAGGLKATVQTNLVVKDNEVDDNIGPGIWCDIYCRDVSIAGNRVHDNTHAGIFYEVSSYGHILDNEVWSNGAGKPQWGWGAGILVSSSGTTEVARNVSAWNDRAAISVISQHRTDWPDVQPTGIIVHNNTMIQGPDGWLLLWGQDWPGPLFDEGAGNMGSNDQYWTARGVLGASPFHWRVDYGSLEAFETSPGESSANWLTDDQRDAALSRAGIPLSP